MKYLAVIMAFAGVAMLVGCGQKDTKQAEVNGPPSKEPVVSARTQKVLNDPNVPASVRAMIQSQQKQHGELQHPAQH